MERLKAKIHRLSTLNDSFRRFADQFDMVTFSFNLFSIVDIVAAIATVVIAVSYFILGWIVRSSFQGSSPVYEAMHDLNPLADYRLQWHVAFMCVLAALLSGVYFLEDNQVPSGRMAMEFVDRRAIYCLQAQFAYAIGVLLLTSISHFTYVCITRGLFNARRSDVLTRTPPPFTKNQVDPDQAHRSYQFWNARIAVFYGIGLFIALSQFIPGVMRVPSTPVYAKSDILHTAPWVPEFSIWILVFAFAWFTAFGYAILHLVLKKERPSLPWGLRAAILLWLGSGVIDVILPIVGICPPGGAPVAMLISSVILGMGLVRDLKLVQTVMNHTAAYADPKLVRFSLSHSLKDMDSRWMTVVFSDLAGFSKLSAALNSNIFKFMSLYRERFTQIIRHYGGLTCKFTGDGMMFFWGAPYPSNKIVDAQCAVACALEMIRMLEPFREEAKKAFNDPAIEALDMRIGIASGVMNVGNVGVAGACDYTVLSDAVNLAASLEQCNKHSATRILVNNTTLQQFSLGETLEGYNRKILFRNVGLFNVKGSKEPIEAFEPIEASPDDLERVHKQIQSLQRVSNLYRRRNTQDCLKAIAEEELNDWMDPQDPRLQLYRRDCEISLSPLPPSTTCLNDSTLQPFKVAPIASPHSEISTSPAQNTIATDAHEEH